MSTTPSTSDPRYTIVGGSRVQQREQAGHEISILVLDRGSRTFRGELFERLLAAGVDEVVGVVGPAPHYDVEQLAGRFERTRFILLGHEMTPGEQINTGLREAASPFVLVVWSDYGVPRIPHRVVERMAAEDCVCGVPAIRGDRGALIPSVFAPAFHGSLFRTIPTQPGKHVPASLYPFDYAGVYQREAFRAIGGYDPRIVNPYWQKLDLGLRVYLWGGKISVLSELRLDAERPLPEDDTTPDAGYARFHLKSLAVRFTGDSGRLPLRKMSSFLLRSGLGPIRAYRLFSEIRGWVRANRYRFVQDARRITELWEVQE